MYLINAFCAVSLVLLALPFRRAPRLLIIALLCGDLSDDYYNLLLMRACVRRACGGELGGGVAVVFSFEE